MPSPELGFHHMGHSEVVPPLSLDGGQLSANASQSPLISPPLGPRQLSLPASSLHEKLQRSPQVGIVHLALQSDSGGLILGWQNEVFAVAEPGASADAFLQSVIAYMRMFGGNKHKKQLITPKLTTIASLVMEFPKFFIGRTLHRFIGRQTQVLADEQEVGAYLFQRTFPSTHLNAEDIRWMAGAWRDRILICTAKYAPPAILIKAFLDVGAKAVITSSLELPAGQPSDAVMASTSALHDKTSGPFVIGEEDDDEETEVSTPDSDWEEGDFERCDQRVKRQEKEEAELMSFITTLYGAVFKDGVSVDFALRQAMERHSKLRFQCHLPKK